MAALNHARLSAEMLSWEPLRMVTPPMTCSKQAEPISTLELCALDMLFADQYSSVLLFYDGLQALESLHEINGVAPPAPPGSQAYAAALADEPVSRLHCALEELLAHYPCAAGVLAHNLQADGRLEIRYPTAAHIALSNNIDIDTHQMNTMAPSNNIVYGVQFHVAHADLSLSDLGDVSDPHPSLDLLFPREPTQCNDSDGHPLPRFIMAFQVTTFICGGFCLAHTCSHAYADGYTVAKFLQNLCSIARGAGLAHPPDMVAGSRRMVIRAREPPTPKIDFRKVIQTRKRAEWVPSVPKHQCNGTAARIVFSLDALEALRKHVTKPGQLKPVSRIQALMALLWTAHAQVMLTVHELPGNHEEALRFPINLRSSGILNITTGYVGNAVFLCTVNATLQELCESSLEDVVGRIRKTVASLDLAECAQSLVDYLELQMRGGLVPFKEGLRMPSLVSLPFYETDCGWGSPRYVGRPGQQLVSEGYSILDDPAARAWNVLTVFQSEQEHACFHHALQYYS